MARLKSGPHLPRAPASPLGELLILHLALLDPAAHPNAPTPPSVPERVSADSVGCDAAERAGSAAPMVHRAHSWPHWWPRLPLDAAQARPCAARRTRSAHCWSASLSCLGLNSYAAELGRGTEQLPNCRQQLWSPGWKR